MNGPAATAPLPTDSAIACRRSSHALSARKSWIIFSRLPCRMSLILTDPIFTSLSRRKSNNLKSPSSLSSLGLEGKAASGTGGEDGLPLMSSARRRSARPPHNGPAESWIRRLRGRWEFAHSIRPASTGASYNIRSTIEGKCACTGGYRGMGNKKGWKEK